MLTRHDAEIRVKTLGKWSGAREGARLGAGTQRHGPIIIIVAFMQIVTLCRTARAQSFEIGAG